MFRNQAGTSIPELTAILLARLGFLWLLVSISFLLPADDASFYAFMGMAFIITIPYSLRLRNKLRTSPIAPLQFVVDLMLVTGLVYFTGGANSDLTMLYPLVILSAGMVGTPKQAIEITVLAIVTYVLMATLLSNHWIIEYMPAHSSVANQAPGLSILLRAFTFALFGGTSIYISKRCQYRDKHHRDLTQTAETLLQNIPSPTVLLDWEGHIL